MNTNTSEPVDAFFRASNAHDSAAMLAAFTEDAVLYNADEGTYRGRDGIKVWDDKEFVGARCTVAITSSVTTGKGEVIVTGDTRGDFPGNQIVLYFLFTVEGGLITALTIHH